MVATFIYALECPDAGVIRYIGKADDPDKRFRMHISRARTTSEAHHSCRWIRSLLRSGKRPILRILECVPADRDWRDFERRHIAAALRAGLPLTNITPGGDGVIVSPDGRRRMSESSRRYWADSEKARRSRAALSKTLKEKHRSDAAYHRRCTDGARRGWAERKKTARFVLDDVRDWVVEQVVCVIFSDDARSAFPTVGRTILARHLAGLCGEGIIRKIGFGIYARLDASLGQIGVEVCRRRGLLFEASDFEASSVSARLRVRQSDGCFVDREVRVGSQWLVLSARARERFHADRVALLRDTERQSKVRREIAIQTWADPEVRAKRVASMRQTARRRAAAGHPVALQ